MPLRDASCQGLVRGLPPAAAVPAQFWLSPVPLNFRAATSPEPPLKVYLNHGRWIAECPDCHGAQLACFDDQRFMCNECGNVAVGNLWRAIEWPTNRSAIEDAVISRQEKNQNWLPGQTPDDLKQESDSHVPKGR
jgi:hypothetical protein